METKSKRTYTKRTPEERKELLTARIAILKLAHATRQKLIDKLEAKLKA